MSNVFIGSFRFSWSKLSCCQNNPFNCFIKTYLELEGWQKLYCKSIILLVQLQSRPCQDLNVFIVNKTIKRIRIKAESQILCSGTETTPAVNIFTVVSEVSVLFLKLDFLSSLPFWVFLLSWRSGSSSPAHTSIKQTLVCGNLFCALWHNQSKPCPHTHTHTHTRLHQCYLDAVTAAHITSHCEPPTSQQ